MFSKIGTRLEYFINKLYWNLHSSTWDDFLNSTDYFSEIDEIIGMIKEYSNSKGARVLDLGCATGTYAIELGKSGFNVTGLDYARKMIAKGVLKASSENLSNVKFIQADFNKKLPFDAESFDVVLTAHTFRATENKNDFFKEINRVLQKNGILFIVLKDKKVGKDKSTSPRSPKLLLLKRIKKSIHSSPESDLENRAELPQNLRSSGFNIISTRSTKFNTIHILRS